ncbi:hypothetical protein ONE63_011492 [Megalurothrips usitatus]|uniref:Uncharacterized protein n=1 Tax=Megalurothrips usitatus TaxID=439358 RepID=A0AAV7WZU8_9NEOP|nr:hypothetical protein ONE63_011492 [Megalurothrips usitatus]
MLCRDGIVFGKDLQVILRCLMDHLFSLVSNHKLVSADMREGMAVSLVATFPKLAGDTVRENDKPWSWIYNRNSNTGKLANIMQQRQRKEKSGRARGGGTQKRKGKPKKTQSVVALFSRVPDSALSKDAKYLKLALATESSKDSIVEKMKGTFDERKALVLGGKYQLNAILEAFPQLKSYQGEMIDLEFQYHHPGKEDLFLLNYSDIASNLLLLAERNPGKYQHCMKFQDDTLNSLLILAEFLPKPKRSYAWEAKMTPDPRVSDLIDVKPLGSNVQHEIEKKREKARHPVQPYLMAIGSRNNFEALCLVLGDSASVQLPKNIQPARAVDLWVKAHYALDVPFILGWKNVLRLLTVHIYKIVPPSEKVSTLMQEWKELNNLSTN